MEELGAEEGREIFDPKSLIWLPRCLMSTQFVNKQVMSDPPPLHQISFLEAFRREKRETVAIVLFDYFIPTHNPRDKKKIHQGYKIKQIISTNFQKFIICRKHLNQVLNATCIIDQRKFLLRPSEWSLAWWNQRAASQTGVIKA